MQTVQDLKNHPFVIIDVTLDKYKDKNLFSEKMCQANKMLETANLPRKKKD